MESLITTYVSCTVVQQVRLPIVQYYLCYESERIQPALIRIHTP